MSGSFRVSPGVTGPDSGVIAGVPCHVEIKSDDLMGASRSCFPGLASGISQADLDIVSDQ